MSRALDDPIFRQLLFSDRKTALAGYQVSDEELESLDLLDEKIAPELIEMLFVSSSISFEKARTSKT